ncbi:MAG: RNB domain-containing ribonuclease [Deltaproteobacteria bacterium]|nr:RNB domain-containing ribonuclease [Deltaproteobacteria bacterium]
MCIGSLVLFFQHGELVSAVCTAHTGTHLQVVCAGGLRLSLPVQRIVHAQPLAALDAADTQQVSDIIAVVEHRQKLLADAVKPHEIWTALAGKPAVYSSRELALLAFGEAAGDDHAAAVVRALQHERIFFKFNGEHFCALDPVQVEQARQRAEQDRALGAEIEQCADWLHAFVNGQETDDPVREQCSRYLRQFAVFGNAAPQSASIRLILKRAGVAPERRECFDVLVRMGACLSDENLLLERHGVPRVWPADIETDLGLPDDACAPQRVNEESIETFSIDDPGTRDIDDAISCETEHGGLRVGIHITDAAALVRPGCALDREAARRGTSVYLPEETLPMLPPELSERRLSLLAGQDRPAVSVFVSLADDGSVRRCSLQLSTIRVTRRLSYQDVDAQINSGGVFQRLHAVLMRSRETRLAAGASGISIPELQVRLSRDRRVVLSVRERETPAQALVAECMILANHSAALFLRDNGVPALYRTQKPGSLRAAHRRADLPLAERVRLRHAFNRTIVETRPRVHAGLGLDCYCSITSPLRKYLDLVMQRQLTAALQARGPVYSCEQLRDIAGALQPVLTRAALVENERRRYWLFKTMEPLRGQVMPALVLSRRKKHYTVLLRDYLLEASADPPDDGAYEPGRDVQVLLRSIDPFEGVISLSIV